MHLVSRGLVPEDINKQMNSYMTFLHTNGIPDLKKMKAAPCE